MGILDKITSADCNCCCCSSSIITVGAVLCIDQAGCHGFIVINVLLFMSSAPGYLIYATCSVVWCMKIHMEGNYIYFTIYISTLSCFSFLDQICFNMFALETFCGYFLTSRTFFTLCVLICFLFAIFGNTFFFTPIAKK